MLYNTTTIVTLTRIDYHSCVLLQHWTKLQADEPWPKDRAQHAACCINFGSEDPQLLISGGKDIVGRVLDDAWLLNVNSAKWKEVSGHCILCTQPGSLNSVTRLWQL